MQVSQVPQWIRIPVLAIFAISTVLVSRTVAQGPNPSEQVRIVDVPQSGAAPTGPHKVVVEHDQKLTTHTIYRPVTLGPSKHSVLVWGEGGCAKNGLTFPEFLTEIASYGFIVMADGPPVASAGRGAGAGGPGGPVGAGRGQGPGANAPRGGPGAGAGPAAGPGAGPGGAAAGPPRGQAPAAGNAPRGGPAGGGAAPAGQAGQAGQGRGAPAGMNADGTPLIQAIDWLARESADSSSRFYQKVDTSRIAAMGMSCGGLMAYNVSADPRIATVGIWNSGLIQPDEKIYAGLHSSVIIVTGGESDIAYANGKRDFEMIPARVPVFYAYYPSVGHGGTYNEDNGGAYGVAAVAWLKWQLLNDTSAKAKGYFVGSPCGLCADSQWKTDSRSL